MTLVCVLPLSGPSAGARAQCVCSQDDHVSSASSFFGLKNDVSQLEGVCLVVWLVGFVLFFFLASGLRSISRLKGIITYYKLLNGNY